jgi:forespore regulator of the sigma-K checkpoint
MWAMNLWKQLKKRLRVRRRWLSLGAVLLLAGGAAWFAGRAGGGSSAPARSVFAPGAGASNDVMEQIKRSDKEREALLLKSYVCGEERQKLGLLRPGGVQKLHAEHPEWTVRLEEDGSVTFVQSVDDLSPACKETAYFGIDENGNLTLYDGVPSKDRVIRTFFQLNIGHLESSLPPDTVKQLYSGIRVGDLAEYNSVLSTFSDYAVEETQKAMKPQTTER